MAEFLEALGSVVLLVGAVAVVVTLGRRSPLDVEDQDAER